MATPTVATPARKGRGSAALAALLPLVLGVAILVLVFGVGPENVLPGGLAPAEELHIEHVKITDDGFRLSVVNSGSVHLRIAQVLVDDAYWQHSVEPSAELDPLERATVRIPYPWVEGEAHEIKVLTHTGAPFVADVPFAIAAPPLDGGFFIRFTGVGLLVGVLPVALGMSFRPLLARADPRVERFVLALTVGLLAFLALDAIEEGLETGQAVAPIYNPTGLLVATALAAFLIVWGLDRWSAARSGSSGLRVAWLVALGIGLHNLGEGLTIGAAWAAGSLAFGTFLILGFTLHNVTEGPAIVAPAGKGRLGHATWLGMLALAGLPTILGGWIGGAAPGPLVVLTFLGLGIGAIVVVGFQVAAYMRSQDPRALTATETLIGFGVGFVVMWATGLLVTV